MGLLAMLLAGVSIFSLCMGSVDIPFRKVLTLIFSNAPRDLYHSIIFNIRLPRIILAIAVGGGLSVAGVILQGIFRNPLVEPYTLGISGGAALAMAFLISFGLSIFPPIAGFLGALIAMSVVYIVTVRRGNWRISTVLLTGVMFSFIASSFIMLIMAVSRTKELQEIVFWIMGSLDQAQWRPIIIVSCVSFGGMLAGLLFAQDLNALSLGEEEAIHLGVNVENIKKILFVLASLITGCVVAVSGIIGFVGLVVPHFMRMFVGSDHRILLPTSFLSGGIFLVICDTFARTVIVPMQLPVGVVTGIIGGILFIYFLSKKGLVLGG